MKDAIIERLASLYDHISDEDAAIICEAMTLIEFYDQSLMNIANSSSKRSSKMIVAYVKEVYAQGSLHFNKNSIENTPEEPVA
jgi:hypothetical protein